MREIGIHGVVLGCLRPMTKEVHFEQLKKLSQAASPLEVTFHKAIDLVPDQIQAVREMTELGYVQAVLTSGGEKSAM